AVSYLSGFRVPFEPLTPPGAILPTTWWNPGVYFSWLWRKDLYARNETFSVVPFLVGGPSLYTSNIDVMRQILSGDKKTSWHKSEDSIVALA
ncbi:hypothetical protein H0H87_007746, partial [Tephrocybe sp. NHM501043]